MDREGAERYLRILAEAELRQPAPDPARVIAIADALTDAAVLDEDTADQILDEFQLNLTLRRHGARYYFGHPSRNSATRRLAAFHPPAPLALTVVPVGQVIRVGKVDLAILSYAETASGALIATSGRAAAGGPLPFSAQPDVQDFTAADDRGARYDVAYTSSGSPAGEWVLDLHPHPRPGPRWLDLTVAAGQAPVWLDLGRPLANPDFTVEPNTLSPAEQLLTALATDLLADDGDGRASSRSAKIAPDALDDIIAALRASGALPAASPLPGQLTTLRRLTAGQPTEPHRSAAGQLTAPRQSPAADLPRPWADVLACRDGPIYGASRAVVSAVFPSLDGVTLAVLGVHNYPESTILYTYLSGVLMPADVPVIWILDSDGHWHATRSDRTVVTDAEALQRTQVVPPLNPRTDWIELHASGRYTAIHARLPLHWL